MSSSSLWHSERLIYRGAEKEDDAFLGKLERDGEAFINSSPWLPIGRSSRTQANFREFLVDRCLLGCIICIPSAEDPDDYTKSTPIGIIHLYGGDVKHLEHHRNTEIGVSIARPYQNKGYATEAITWVLRWSFRRANLHRVGIGAFGFNEGAIRLYERMGFRLESRKKDALWSDGKYNDLVELGMLEDEWRARYDGATA